MSHKSTIKPIPRAAGVSDRLVAVGLGARFVDEILSGLPNVLMPTIRATLGLSYTQVSLLGLALNYTAAIIEPIAGLLIDVWKRPWIMAWGAAGVGLATVVIGLAPTLFVLMAGFVIYGLASGPLAHTGDVTLIEAYPEAPGRISARSTLLDTVGALLAPLMVSLTIWVGLSWRWLLAGLGASSLAYALIILRTPFPMPINDAGREGGTLRAALGENVRRVLDNRATRTWLLFLLVLDLLEAPMTFTTIWLREEAGLSQALIGVYTALEMGVAIISLAVLDRWLVRTDARRILLVAAMGMLVLYPAWLLIPGIWPRFLLAVPLSFLFTVFWPIGRAQSLASAPGRAGTVSAVNSLLGFLPIPLLFGLLAELITLTPAMLWVEIGAIMVMIALVLRMPGGRAI